VQVSTQIKPSFTPSRSAIFRAVSSLLMAVLLRYTSGRPACSAIW
jgi:hypothetical protein